MYPPNDFQFEEVNITQVDKSATGWTILREDGWSFYVPNTSPIEPKVDMIARFYGKGIGSTVRGLYLDSQEVFYRTESQDKEHNEIEMYGKDTTDWLVRWDAGKSVWSISMGGLGPGYEQAIQITTAEIIRHLLEQQYDYTKWENKEVWKQDKDKIEAALFANPKVDALGLSGAMWGAAMNLALQFYRRGPREVMNDERVKDRHIQVSKAFPQYHTIRVSYQPDKMISESTISLTLRPAAFAPLRKTCALPM